MGQKITRGRAFRWAVLFFSLAMTGFPAQNSFRAASGANLCFTAQEDASDREEWMGIYLKGEKVGYSKMKIRREGDGYKIFEESFMYVNSLGTDQRIESKTTSKVDLDYSLRSFDYYLLSGQQAAFSLHGEVAESGLNLVMVSGKNTTRFTLPIKNIPVLSGTLTPYIFKQGLKEGKKLSLPFFDPSTLCSRDITIDVLRKESLSFCGKELLVFKIKKYFAGIETLAFVSEAGYQVKEEGPMGLTLIKETQEQALSGDWMKQGKRDLSVALAIPIAAPIAHARAVKSLTVKISNLPLKDFDLAGGRQSLEGDCLKIRQEEPGVWETFTLPYPNQDLKPYLQPTPLIQSNDERIITQARKIVGDNRDAETAARKLSRWVFSAIKKKPTVSIPNALDILDRRAGDCNEHTALFTALSRSQGIPTRVCAGIVYLDDKFYYHSWPEIYLNRWVAVDPTFNQFPADATHIRLAAGDLSNQIKILQVINNIKLEIINYS